MTSQASLWTTFTTSIFTARKRSCGKVMFLQVCVILFTGESGPGGGLPGPRGIWSRGSGTRGGGVWSQGCLVLGGGGCLVLGVTGGEPPDGYCCGRYASYWNVLLLILFLSSVPNGVIDLLLRAVRILLECIIVNSISFLSTKWCD